MKKDYQNLLIWQKAHKIFQMVCEDISQWPSNPIARSISYQVTDSAGSMGATIAEGYGRGGPREFEQFLRYSRGSSSETDHWMFEAQSNNLISPDRLESYRQKISEFQRMLAGFIAKLRTQKSR